MSPGLAVILSKFVFCLSTRIQWTFCTKLQACDIECTKCLWITVLQYWYKLNSCSQSYSCSD